MHVIEHKRERTLRTVHKYKDIFIARKREQIELVIVCKSPRGCISGCWQGVTRWTFIFFMKKWSVDDRPKLQSTAIHAYSEIENEHHIKSLTASSGGGNSKANMNCSIIKCNKYIHMIAFIDKLAMDCCRMSLLTLCYSRIVPFSRAHAFKPPYWKWIIFWSNESNCDLFFIIWWVRMLFRSTHCRLTGFFIFKGIKFPNNSINYSNINSSW